MGWSKLEEQINYDPSKSINEEQILKSKIARGSSWFLWIAALSLINTIIALFHGTYSFVIGLFTTQILDAIPNEMSPMVKGIALATNLVIIGIYAGIWVGAKKCLSWVLITGFVLYCIDTILMVFLGFLAKDIGNIVFSGLFHLWALSAIWGGMKASIQLKKLQSSIAYIVASES